MIDRSTNVGQALRQRQRGFILNPYRFGSAPSVPTVTWNPSDKSSDVTLSNGNRDANHSVAAVFDSVRATDGRSSGKWYWEVSTLGTSADTVIGIATLAMSLDSYVGGDTVSYGYYQANGQKLYNAAGTAYGSAFTGPHTVGVALDLSALKIWFRRDGVWQGGGDPTAGTNPAFTIAAGTYFPAVSLYQSGLICTARFRSANFVYSAPTGFSAYGA